MDLGLSGLSGVVVGAGRGLGAATVDSLLGEGASVLAVSRSREPLVASLDAWRMAHPGCNVEGLVMDMSQETATVELAKAVADRDRCDFLIVTSGTGRPGDGSLYNRFLYSAQRNLAPCLNSVEAIIEPLAASQTGSILFVSSIAALDRIACPSEYSAVKGALHSYAKHLAAEFAPLRVNVLAPGNMSTDGSIWREKARNDPSGLDAFLAANVPLRRIGEPPELARVATFMVSPACSFMTGSSVVVDGGQARCIR